MSEAIDLKRLDARIERYRAKTQAWVRTFFWHRRVIANFVAQFEHDIANLATSELTSTEMRSKISADVLSKLHLKYIPKNQLSNARTMIDYLEALLDRRDLALRLGTPADAKVSRWASSNGKRTLKVSLRWTSTGEIDPEKLGILAISFFNHYRRREPPFPYSAKLVQDLGGVSAVHLFEQGALKEFPGSGVRIYELTFDELDGATLPRERLPPTPHTSVMQHAWEPSKPKPVGFRWHSGEFNSDSYIELLFDPDVKDDNYHTFLFDKERHIHIESDLGPEAWITWKYDAARINARINDKNFALPVIREEDTISTAFWGDLPMGIERRFATLAGEIWTEEHPWTGKKLTKPTYCHNDFEESGIWDKEKFLPIKVLAVKFKDRRPQMPDVPAPPPPGETVYLGMATPPPDPNAKKVDKWMTPYWEYPKLAAPEPAVIPYAGRQTVYILGQPGKGKSTLMLSMFRQDVASGKGVCLIDPHGDFADLALRNIPRSRWDDVVYFDPIKCPIGIDFLRSTNDLERDVLADDLYAIFKKLTEGGGERMDAILKNAFQLLLRTPGATFLDIYRLVTEPEWREATAKKYATDTLRDFWLVQYPKYPQPATSEPIISRMQRFHANQALRTLTGAVSNFDFYEVVRHKKLLICNLSAAYLRGDTKEIIGSLLVMHLHLAALKQATLPESQRTPLYLYVDEFQTFGSSSFNEIITGARKFGLRLTLANQFLDQLTPETRDAVRIAETRFYFRLQDEDARRLGTSVGGFNANDLMNLDIGEAILRPGKPSDTRKVRINPPTDDGEDATEYVTARTLEAYAARNIGPVTVMASDDDPEPGEWPGK